MAEKDRMLAGKLYRVDEELRAITEEDRGYWEEQAEEYWAEMGGR